MASPSHLVAPKESPLWRLEGQVGLTLELLTWTGLCGPTFHIEGLELQQVPNRAWEMSQLVLFHVQYLRKKTIMQGAHRTTVSACSALPSSRHRIYLP